MELLIVVVIVGILATIAMPNFTRSVERAKVHDARTILGAIFSAERVYRLDQGTFGAMAQMTAANYYPDPDANNNNADWNFAIAVGGGGATFTATATRTGGAFNGNTITVNENGDYGGTHPLR